MGTNAVPSQVADLVERFDRNRDSYLAGGINEMQFRRSFQPRCWEPLAVSCRPIAHVRRIAATDKRIDALVNELYGLTQGGIRIVDWN